MATHIAPILERILASRRAFISELKTESEALDRSLQSAPPPRDFRQALIGPGVALIAECKERSPSGGILQRPYDPVALARRYAAAGASALSVLTEPEFFGGSLDDLRVVRGAVDVPVLCKDFVVDRVQLIAARAAGADAVLLIVGILSDIELARLHRDASELGMQALVEVHDEAEVDRALDLRAAIIGINNRDLTRMTTDKDTTVRLRPRIPPDRIVVSESGIDRRTDVETLHRLGVNAALIGESLLRAPDVEAKLRELSGR
ncbi:MAG TPA: indole-3-glycerol phosphate synthase TrpC [Candidatus Acidoferrum sp.]|nr:indole-3-glycerol phosphate synthase TrpC [Candidatus Acidoferrum sp.]